MIECKEEAESCAEGKLKDVGEGLVQPIYVLGKGYYTDIKSDPDRSIS